MAIYATLDDVDNMGVFQVTTKPMLTISFYAYLMPPYESYASKFYLLWIKLLDENLRYNLNDAGFILVKSIALCTIIPFAKKTIPTTF